MTAELLGGWALGARNVLCLSGDPISIGDHPDATVVNDLSVPEVVGLIRRLRDEGVTLSGAEVDAPPRYLIGVADLPLAEPYDPARLDHKLDAGADVIWTQIAYDVEALAAWADLARARGVFERAEVLIGLMPLRTARGARFMDEKLPGRPRPARDPAGPGGRRRRRRDGRPRAHDRGRPRHPGDRRRERRAPDGDGPRRQRARGRRGRRSLPASHRRDVRRAAGILAIAGAALDVPGHPAALRGAGRRPLHVPRPHGDRSTNRSGS